MITASPRPYAVVVTPVLPYPPVAGGHKRILRLAEAIARAGAVPHLLTEDPASPDGADALRDRGWRVDVLPAAPQGVRGRTTQHVVRRPSPYLRELAERLAQLAPGAAFVQFEHTQSAYYWEAANGRPVVFSTHNADSRMLATIARAQPRPSLNWARAWNRAFSTAAVQRRATKRADAVICVSEEDAAFFRPSARDVIVAPNGVDPELLTVPEPRQGGEDVLFFGHFGHPPNVIGIKRFLAEGWPLVAAARPAARLRIAGARSPESLRRLAGTTAGAEMIGFVEDLVAEIERAAAVVVPLWQGGGTRLKVLEALASARPVVATPEGVEGIGFRAGVHGLSGADPAALAQGLLRVLSEPATAARLGRAGRELAATFAWPAATAPAEALYRRLLGI